VKQIVSHGLDQMLGFVPEQGGMDVPRLLGTVVRSRNIKDPTVIRPRLGLSPWAALRESHPPGSSRTHRQFESGSIMLAGRCS